MTPWREILIGLAVTASAAAGGSAIDVRDRVAKAESNRDMDRAVQAERDKAAEERFQALRADLSAIKHKLGVTP